MSSAMIGKTAGQILKQMEGFDSPSKVGIGGQPSGATPGVGKTFAEHLGDGIKDVNANAQAADKAALDVASGKPAALHETMLALTKAELSFNLMVQVRNKALEAYQEIMRMPV